MIIEKRDLPETKMADMFAYAQVMALPRAARPHTTHHSVAFEATWSLLSIVSLTTSIVSRLGVYRVFSKQVSRVSTSLTSHPQMESAGSTQQ